jgi:hypothetical protein
LTLFVVECEAWVTHKVTDAPCQIIVDDIAYYAEVRIGVCCCCCYTHFKHSMGFLTQAEYTLLLPLLLLAGQTTKLISCCCCYTQAEYSKGLLTQAVEVVQAAGAVHLNAAGNWQGLTFPGLLIIHFTVDISLNVCHAAGISHRPITARACSRKQLRPCKQQVPCTRCC